MKTDQFATPEPENLFRDMPLGDYREIGLRRKWWIILPALAIFTCAAVVVRRMPNIYRAQTVILVDPQEVPAAYVTSTVSTTVSDRLSAINQEVLSPERLERLVDKLGLYPQLRGQVSDQRIVANMQKSITVDVANPGGGRLSAFTVAFSGRNPQEVAKVTNELAQVFIQENLKVREQQSDGTADFLASELADTKSQVDAKQQQIQKIKSLYIQDLPESQQYHLESLTNLQNQLRASEDHVAQAQQEKVLLQSMAGNNPPTLDLDEFGGGGAAASSYDSQIQKLEVTLAAQRQRYGPNFPDLRKTEAELDELKAKAAAEAKNQPEVPDPATMLSGQSGRRPNPVLAAQLGKLDEQIQDETKSQAQMQQDINFHVQKLEQAPVFEQQISGLMRDYDALNHQYASLLDKKLAAEMANALEARQKAERFVVLDEAKVPDVPFSPNRPLLYLAGLVGGLLCGLGLAVLMEMTDESVRSEKEAARILGKPVLVGIPRILSGKQKTLRRLGVSAALAGTAFCSAAIGLLISRFTALPF